MVSKEEIERQMAETAAIKKRAERETRQTVTARERDYVPMWERIQQRRIDNSFSAEYTLSLTPRGR